MAMVVNAAAIVVVVVAVVAVIVIVSPDIVKWPACNIPITNYKQRLYLFTILLQYAKLGHKFL